MPHKVLERQYQLQAQKRHEQNLKFDYYKQTARYFEREAALAKQFNSWINREPSNYSKRLEKSKHADQLRARREKLNNLLVEEEQLYKRELGLQTRKRQQPQETISLEQLKFNLLQRRAEEGLYYPSSCRKTQAHIFSPTNNLYKSTDVSDATIAVNDGQRFNGVNGPLNPNVKMGPTEPNGQRHARFSSNPSIEKILYNNTDAEKSSYAVSTSSKGISVKSYPNPRYTIRYSRRSLEGTNIGNADNMDGCNLTRQNSRLKDSPLLINVDHDDPKHDTSVGTRSMSNHEDNRKENDKFDENGQTFCQAESLSVNDNNCFTTTSNSMATQSSADTLNNSNIDQYKKGSDYETESKYSSGTDMSRQMYRYLKYNELKRQILDLCKREHLFVNRQCWSEALRLREMRNKINLLKNKNIFENLDLKINKETRQCGLEAIQAIEALNNKRTKLCNSLIYSDEAKAMWKQWVHEDDEVTKIETNVMRNLHIHQLEEDWKNLALRDKNRISQLHHRIMKKSDLQDEYKLMDIINVANNRQNDCV